MEKFNIRKEWPFWLIIIAPLIYILAMWGRIPQTVPMHFGIDGEPDGWGAKETLFILPGVNIFIYLLLFYLPAFDPKRKDKPFPEGSFYKIRLATTAFLSIICGFITYVSITGSKVSMHWLPALIFLLLALLGNFMINIKPNWFIGIRTPWTLSNDNVWRKTHQVGGRVWFYGGLVGLACSLFLKPEYTMGLLVAFALGSALIMVGYSFWLYKQETAANQ